MFFFHVQLSFYRDTAGQERFRSITQSYYRSAHALILVYDISCQPTFDCLPDWLREIQEYANSKVLKILVGNKTDRDDREIPTAIGEEFAKQQGMYFLETSAKEADNVERLFYEIAAELIEQARTKEVSVNCSYSFKKKSMFCTIIINLNLFSIVLQVPRSETGGISNLGTKANLLSQTTSNCCNNLNIGPS